MKRVKSGKLSVSREVLRRLSNDQMEAAVGAGLLSAKCGTNLCNNSDKPGAICNTNTCPPTWYASCKPVLSCHCVNTAENCVGTAVNC
jgi:hypothetical protein